MNPYLFTITFLMLMSFLTSSELSRCAQTSLEKKCYLDMCHTLAAADELKTVSQLEELRGKKGEKHIAPDPEQEEPRITKPLPKNRGSTQRIPALRINTSRPPNNSRLNIYTLLHRPDLKQNEAFSLYESVAHLMRTLYAKEPFFQKYPHIEYAIIDKLIEKKELTTGLTSPDQLTSVVFEDPQLQEVFYLMCQGTNSSPSLLHFLTFDSYEGSRTEAWKINLLFADPRILHAVFPENEIVELLIQGRTKIWNEILYQEEHRHELVKEQCKGRGAFGKDLQALLQEVLSSHNIDYENYKKYVFDCTLGKLGNVLFFADPQTGMQRREKIPTQ